MDKKWKSIKVKEETYKELKGLGTGISRAVDILVKSQKKRFEKKLKDIEASAGEIAEVLLNAGFFDVKFKGAGVEDIEEDGNIIRIKGFINVEIPNDEARKQILEVLKKEEA